MRWPTLIATCLAAAALPAQAQRIELSVISGVADHVVVPPETSVHYAVIGHLSGAPAGAVRVVRALAILEKAKAETATTGDPQQADGIEPRAAATDPGQAASLDEIDGALRRMVGAPVRTSFILSGHAAVVSTGEWIAPAQEGLYRITLEVIDRRPGQPEPAGASDAAIVGDDAADDDADPATPNAGSATGANSIKPLIIEVRRDAPVIVGSIPPPGAIDARRPFSADGLEFDGWDTIELLFDGDASTVTATDLVVTHDHQSEPPAILRVDRTDEGLIVALSDMIAVSAWTTITHKPSGTAVRFGYLPGDVDGSRHADAQDIIALMQHLNRVATRPPHQVDIDRNEKSDPDDLADLIDLLYGKDTLPAFLDAKLAD